MIDTELSLLATLAVLGFILALLPLPWLASPANAGMLALMFWVLVLCFVTFINSFAWSAPVWCDIATKLMIGACVGVPASLCCLTRHLYDLIRDPDSTLLHRKFLYSIWMDASFAFVAPAFIIFLHIIFQDYRYVIYEEAGCFPSIYPSTWAYIVVFIWPVLFGSISLAYTILTLRKLRKHNYELPEYLCIISTTNSDCFYRMLIFSLGGLIGTIAIGIFLLCTNFNGVALRPFGMMERDLNRVLVLPISVWKANPRTRGLVELRWACPALALMFFTIFALTPEMRTRYLMIFGKIRMHFSKSAEIESISSFYTRPESDMVLPVFVHQSHSSRDTNGCLHSTAAVRPRNSFTSETITIVPPSPPKNAPILLEWPCYNPPSPTASSHVSIPDSMPSIPSETSDNASSLTYGDTFPRATRSGATSRCSYVTCAPCDDGYPCHY